MTTTDLEGLADWFSDHVAVDKGYFKKDAQAKLERVASILRRVAEAPIAIMDTRDVLGICAPTEEDFPALYAIQGQRVALVRVGEP